MAQPVLISYVFEDVKQKQLSLPTYYRPDIVNSLANAQAVATVASEYLGVVSGCSVVEAYVKFPLTVATPVAAVAGYNVRSGATLSFENAQPRITWSPYIPGWLDALFSGESVDLNGAGVANLTNAWIAGGGITGGYQATDPQLLDLTAVVSGRASVRKVRRSR